MNSCHVTTALIDLSLCSCSFVPLILVLVLVWHHCGLLHCLWLLGQSMLTQGRVLIPYHVTAAAALLHQGKVYANSSKSGYLPRDNRPQCSVIVKDVEPIKCD